MAEAEEEEKKKKRVGGVESLGWLTESTIMPKKHKSINGVGASSIFQLKAELYKSQQESKHSKDFSQSHPDYHRAKRKLTPNNPFSRMNSGVQSRAHLDKLALKSVSDGSASYAALEKKAELYDKLARGELSDEEYEEKYSVDFFRKSHLERVPKEPQNNGSTTDEVFENKNADDDSFIQFDSKPQGLGRTSGSVDLDEHKRFVREVHEEANQGREKASELKLRRQEHAAARREKLKKEYLRKQLEKIKAASSNKQEQT